MDTQTSADGRHDEIRSDFLAVEAVALTRRFGVVTALDNVSLSIGRGEFFSLLGPSGCGKTTFLRIVAGLDAPDAGTLFIGKENGLALPAHRRSVNTVFQSYALFPHLNVWDNVAFGLRMKKVESDEVKRRVGDVLDMTRITELASRRPHQLSGGQKQRVALARGIVNQPNVLLLDEPLAALDVKLRRELQSELHALQRRLGMTFVHVTHDQDEALGLSDRIAVMNAGRVVQLGTAAEIYEQPRTRFVAQFVGGCNLFSARISGDSAQTQIGTFQLPGASAQVGRTLAIRPERVAVGAQAGPMNRFDGVVEDLTYTGPETQLSIRVAGELMKATVINTSARRWSIGLPIAFSLPPEAIIVLED